MKTTQHVAWIACLFLACGGGSSKKKDVGPSDVQLPDTIEETLPEFVEGSEYVEVPYEFLETTEISCSADSDCFVSDACSKGRCLPNGLCTFDPVSCDDADKCTQDLCDPVQGCLHLAIPGCQEQPCKTDLECDDSDQCTFDACIGGKCIHSLLSCDDLDDCTTDACTPAAGCTHTPIPGCFPPQCENDAKCDDGNACTVDACDRAAKLCVHKPLSCDDGDPCTVDSCQSAIGCVHTADPACGCHDSSQCDDGNFCTVDVCASGQCAYYPTNCEDGDDCTKDSCEPPQGCVHVQIPGCNVFCKSDQDCNDGNPCTQDGCDPVSANPPGCFYSPEPEGMPCDDANLCTVYDMCLNGGCLGTMLNCNDGDDCTYDYCDPFQGCVNVPDPSCIKPCQDNASCDDGNQCTVDQCVGGQCIHGLISCEPAHPCDAPYCDPIAGCVHVQSPDCCTSDSECALPDLCTIGMCDVTMGRCMYSERSCDDGDPCTKDWCDNDVGCRNVTDPACGCHGNWDCDDGDPCTTDNCDLSTGKCLHFFDGCDDGNACTADKCDPAAGGCIHFALNCDDGNACSKDSCDPQIGCVYAQVPGCCVTDWDCNDANACTKDACSANLCVHESLVCVDNDPCTKDWCDKQGGCKFDRIPGCGPCANAADCDDADACTTDACVATKCTHTAKNCSDGNACTDDSCTPATGACVHAPNAAACEDGSLCTTGDVCKDGACKGGAYVNCDDKNACTTDSCTPKEGCKHAAKNCDDGDACTTDSCDATTGACAHVKIPACGKCTSDAECADKDLCTTDKCTAGSCTHTAKTCTDGTICTDDTCDPATGACVFKPNTAACEDGNKCTTGDVCKAGKCTSGAYLNCDDKNACTTDACSPATGCTHTAIPGCTTCKVAADCDDKNVCTTDACDAATGKCSHASNTVACEDGNKCTTGDVCKSGSCTSGAYLNCDDKNACTKDSCDIKTGCVNAPIPGCVPCKVDGDCNDNSACTTEKCTAGVCAYTTITCKSDGNTCTDDVCDPQAGCVYKPNTLPCSDGNACTTGDTCKGGKCVYGAMVNCDDGSACTKDSCVPATGCKHEKIPNCVCGKAADCNDSNANTCDCCCDFGSGFQCQNIEIPIPGLPCECSFLPQCK